MSSREWRRVSEIFGEASELPREERGSFLEAACDGDRELRREVEALLEADTGAGSFLEEPAIDQAARELAERERVNPVEESLGGQASSRQIGSYRLEGVLGAGGMGTVYRAVRVGSGFRQEVALKVIQAGLASPEDARRFQRERQILADLEHPAIARLYGGGTTDEGSPYIVMERVDGRPIDRFCEELSLDLNGRLDLFTEVCAAVAHAHRKLVVHLDLKPSNILVTEEGAPKLLDFGIARWMQAEPGGAPAAQATMTRNRALTPDYASPELVRNAPVSTSSDVYSLGVLLYRLLTGRQPYETRGLTPTELERVVCEEPVQPPSRVAEFDGRRLEGDLDAIVATATAKEPDRRYRSVEELADDVRRYLDKLPIKARPASVGYRLSRFARRHHVAVAAALAVMVALAVGVAGVAWQARVASQERDRARLAAAEAEEVSEFLRGMLASADPTRRGRDVRVADVLGSAAERAETELAGRPELQATVLETLGTTYEGLGLYQEAQALLTQSLEISRRTHGGDDSSQASLLTLLGQVAVNRADYALAESHYRKAASVTEASGTADPLALAASLDGIAVLLRNRGEYRRAEELYREVLDTRRGLLGEVHPDVAQSRRSHATVLMFAGEIEASDVLFREALPFVREAFPGGHPELAKFLSNYGWNRLILGDVEGAEDLMSEAIQVQRELLGEEHPDVAIALINLAILRQHVGDFEQAEEFYERSWAMQRELLGPEHPESLENRMYQGLFLIDRGDRATGRVLLEEVLSAGGDHPYLALSLDLMADYLSSRGNLELAERLARRSLEIRRTTLGPEDPALTPTVLRLARALRRLEAYDAAASLLTAHDEVLGRGDQSVSPREREETAELLVELRSARGHSSR